MPMNKRNKTAGTRKPDWGRLLVALDEANEWLNQDSLRAYEEGRPESHEPFISPLLILAIKTIEQASGLRGRADTFTGEFCDLVAEAAAALEDGYRAYPEEVPRLRQIAGRPQY
jgi:hypothetical protein